MFFTYQLDNPPPFTCPGTQAQKNTSVSIGLMLKLSFHTTSVEKLSIKHTFCSVIQERQILLSNFQISKIPTKDSKMLFFRSKLIQMCKDFSKILMFRYCYFTSKFFEESLSKMTHFQQPDEVEKLIWSFF